jgi:hypothetical protein
VQARDGYRSQAIKAIRDFSTQAFSAPIVLIVPILGRKRSLEVIESVKATDKKNRTMYAKTLFFLGM